MRRAAVVLGVLALAAGAHAAPPQRILLPSVRTPLSPGPPLQGNAAAVSETRFLGTITSSERVRVGVDAAGAPVSISVVQRLLLPHVGDYTFTVPGPITDVAPVAGTQSDPGLRTDSIVWSGFSAGTKVLAARATLRVAPAAKLLPLRIRRVGNAVVLENATAAKGTLLVGPVSARDVRIALRETRLRVVPDRYVAVPYLPKAVQTTIVAPLRITGSIGSRRVRATVARRLVLRAPATAQVHLLVTPVVPAVYLTPSLAHVSWARLTAARVRQFGQYLANPDPNGSSTATYLYVSAPRTQVIAAAIPKHDGRDWTLAYVLAGVLGAAGLAVWWAHS